MPIITTTDITASREIASVDVSASNAVIIGTEELRSDFSSSIASRVGSAGGGETNEYSFKTISVAGQSDVVADTTTDTLTLAAGSNMTITTDASTDTITFASSGGGGGGGGSGIFAATGSIQATTGNIMISGSTSGLGFPALHISGSMSSSINSVLIEGSGSKVFEIKGTQGQLFSITDELSGSLFSVNTISGTPVIEAFSDNKVTLGSFSQPLIITGSANGGTSISSSINTTASFGMILVNGTDVSSSLGSGGGGGGGGITISNNSNNRILTGDGSNANAEQNLLYDGTALIVTGSSSTKGAITAFMSSNGRALELIGDNRDVDFRMGGATYAGQNGGYGFFWRYRGTNTGNDNDLQLWSENQAGTDVQIYEVKQDGAFTLYGGSNTAFIVNSSGEITKIGQDSPSSGQFLKWDGSKVVWDDASGGGGGGSSIWTSAGNVKYANASLELTGSSTANPALFISTSAVPVSASTPTLDVHGSGSVLQVKGTQGQLFSVDNKYAYSALGYASGSWQPETFMTASAIMSMNSTFGLPIFTIYEDSTLELPLAKTTQEFFLKRNMTMHVSGTTHPAAVYTASQDGDASLKVSGIGQVFNVVSEDARAAQFSVGSTDVLGTEVTEFTSSTAFTAVSPFGLQLFSVHNDSTFTMGQEDKRIIDREGNLFISQSTYGIGSGTDSLDSLTTLSQATLKLHGTGSLILAQNRNSVEMFSVSEDWGDGPYQGPEGSREVTSSFFSVATKFGLPTFEAYNDGTYKLGVAGPDATIDREGFAFFSSSMKSTTEKTTADPTVKMIGTGSILIVGEGVFTVDQPNQIKLQASEVSQTTKQMPDQFAVGSSIGTGPLKVTARNTVELGEGIPLTVIGTSAPQEERNAVTQSGFPSLSPFNTVYSLGPYDNSGWESSTSSSYGTSSASPEAHAFSGKVLKVGTSDVERGQLYVLRQDVSTPEQGHWYKAVASVAASGSTNLLAVACGTGKSYEVGMLIEGVIRLEDKMMEDAPEIGAEVYVSGTKNGGYDITPTSTSGHFVRIIGNVIQKNAQNNTDGHTPYNDCLIYFNPDRTSVTLA
jgi:hypothetical protein